MAGTRVRNVDGKVPLSSLAQLQDQDIFDDDIKDRMMPGVSTRNYEPVVKSWSDKLSISKSNVSRAFIKSSRKDLEKINTQDLSKFECITMITDGVDFGESEKVEKASRPQIGQQNYSKFKNKS